MYDEDEIGWEWGATYGLPYQEVVSAIQSRGVSDVAIFGYSNGGGSTYELTWALNQNAIGNRADITLPFAVPFTSYIDAITDSWVDAENQRPLLSQYHVSQYQRNTGAAGLYLNGGPSNADDDLNRSHLQDSSGQPVVHTTIDDHIDVLEFLKARLRQNVLR